MNKYLRHIKQLCRKHRITLYTGKTYKPFCKRIGELNYKKVFSIPILRAIAIPNIKEEFNYFCALHEIGHVLTTRKKDMNKVAWANTHKKVTRFIIVDEHKASSVAFRLNKLGCPKYNWLCAVENQLAYIKDYEAAWKYFYMDKHYVTFPLPPHCTLTSLSQSSPKAAKILESLQARLNDY